MEQRTTTLAHAPVALHRLMDYYMLSTMKIVRVHWPSSSRRFRRASLEKAQSNSGLRALSPFQCAVKSLVKLWRQHSKIVLDRARETHFQFEQRCEYRFWTSRQALLIYADLVLAVAAGRIWILYVACAVLFSEICWIVFKWIVYFLDDPEIWAAVSFADTWLQLFLQKGERILTGKDATAYVMAGAVAYTMPTGFNYFRSILRARAEILHQEYLRHLTEDACRRHQEYLKHLTEDALHRTKENALIVIESLTKSDLPSVITTKLDPGSFKNEYNGHQYSSGRRHHPFGSEKKSKLDGLCQRGNETSCSLKRSASPQRNAKRRTVR